MKSTQSDSQQLTPGGGKTPVIRKCDKFSNAGVKKRVVQAERKQELIVAVIILEVKPSLRRHGMDFSKGWVPPLVPCLSDSHHPPIPPTSLPLDGQSFIGHDRAVIYSV